MPTQTKQQSLPGVSDDSPVLSIGTHELVARYTSFFDTMLHSHDFYEIVFILHGSIIHCVNGKKIRLKSGDAFIIVPGIEHSYERDAECAHRDIMISKRLLETSCNFLDQTLFAFINERKLINFSMTKLQMENFENVYMLFNSAVKLEIKHVFQKMLCCQLLTILYADTQQQVFSNDFKNKCISIINDYYNNKNVHQILRNELGYTHGHFCKKFKKEFSMSPTDFINQKRLNEATIYLIFSDYTVEKCCELVGFDSPPYFLKLFKQQFGTTPSKYRHAHINPIN